MIDKIITFQFWKSTDGMITSFFFSSAIFIICPDHFPKTPPANSLKNALPMGSARARWAIADKTRLLISVACCQIQSKYGRHHRDFCRLLVGIPTAGGRNPTFKHHPPEKRLQFYVLNIYSATGNLPCCLPSRFWRWQPAELNFCKMQHLHR